MADQALSVFDAANFDAAVVGRPGVTVVEFWSTTCVPCRQLAKVLSQLQGEVPDGVVIGQVNADENGELAERLGVRAVPTLLVLKDGEVVERRSGVDRRQVLKKLIEAHSQSDRPAAP